MSDVAEAGQHFTELFGETFDGLVWVGAFLADKGGSRGGRFCRTAQEAATHAIAIDEAKYSGVYHSSALFDPERIAIRQGVTPNTRGTEEDVRSAVGLFLDVDIAGAGHKSGALPATFDQAWEVIGPLLPPPSRLQFTGGGYYPGWLFEKPIIFEDSADVRAFKASLRERSLEIIEACSAAGFHLDSTFDLARVLRVPGTTNHKSGTPIVSRVESRNSVRYSTEELRIGTLRNRIETNPAVSAGIPDDPFIRASTAMRADSTPTPWTQDQADREIDLQIEKVITADAAINTTFGGAARRIGRFVGPFITEEDALTRLLAGSAANTYHSDQWNADSGLAWSAESVFRTALQRGMKDGVFEKSDTKRAPADTVEQAITVDEVDALIGRMLTAQQMSERPAPEPLVWGLLDRDSLASVVGLPGSFKSFWSLDLAGHIGQGREWHGHRVHQGLCVYIAAEGDRGMTLRTRAWEERYGPMRDVLFLPEPVQIADPHAWDVLVKACERLKPVFVVADTQSMMTLGMEENSNSEMNVAMDAFRRIQRASRACVLAVHHTTKDGTGVRGGSAQEGAHDTRIRLTRLEPRASMIVKMADEKQKDMAEGELAGARLVLDVVSLGEDPVTGRPLSSLVLSEREVKPDDFIDGSGVSSVRTETEQTVIPDVEPWAMRLAEGSEVRARLLQVVWSVGQEEGLEMAEARRHVAARWYGGKQARTSRDEGLIISTFDTGWKYFAGLSKQPGAAETALVHVSGQRYCVNPEHASPVTMQNER